MWVPIFMQNRTHILDVLDEHIAQLSKFRAGIAEGNTEILKSLIEEANKISRILK
jgi:prephenate dehydrogenase